MQLKTSYRQILSISVPIILGSAVQNVIALSDSVFLYHKSNDDFAAIGFVSVFYLIIAAIGYGFSKGGQIIIARRMYVKSSMAKSVSSVPEQATIMCLRRLL